MSTKASLWDSGHDEPVEVNQRALIDKVLARYSGEYTVFRELLQNADDARAKRVEIRFETQSYIDRPQSPIHTGTHQGASSPPLPNLLTQPVSRWTFKNDGDIFRDEDWNRLKKIAEGNPDEAKIGAFGVGFYSLFSITEAPVVKSGNEWMGFYWKDGKDQLFVRRGNLRDASDTSDDPWTHFEMDLRESGPIPGRPIDMGRFLATSITFMNYISEVSLWFDQYRLIHVNKDAGPPRNVAIPGNLKNSTPSNMMLIKSISLTNVLVRASVIRWVYTLGTAKQAIQLAPLPQPTFFSSLFSSFKTPKPSSPDPKPPSQHETNLLEVLDASVQIQIYSAEADVKLPKKMAQELERATKKKHPTTCSYRLIYTGKDAFDASIVEDTQVDGSSGSIFQGLRADIEGKGLARVFIGHATAQTTGHGGHHASRFIPTVEREAIDLVDPTISVWNKELLYVGGYLSRTVYEVEMNDINTRWAHLNGNKDETVSPSAIASLEAHFVHVSRFFGFKASTPSSLVSQHLEDAFFECSKDRSIQILSSKGVKSARLVRLPDSTFSGFLKEQPIVPADVLAHPETVVSRLRERHVITDITFDDILNELRLRPLSETEMIECLKWRITLPPDLVQAHPEELNRQFYSAATFITSPVNATDERVVSLATTQSFFNPKSGIPPDAPLPLHTIPFTVSRQLPLDRLKTSLRWNELSISSWVAFLVSPDSASVLNSEHRLTENSTFAERVLGSLGKIWSSLSLAEKNRVLQLLKTVACMPTLHGMKKPGECYFPNVDMFSDLAVVSMAGVWKGDKEKFLLALGVRDRVDLQEIFTRLMASGEWSVPILVSYLVRVRNTLTEEEFNKLRQTAVFHSSLDPRIEGTPSTTPQRKRYTASELYEPSDEIAALQLPTLEWKDTKWRPNSPEAKLLFFLGLKKNPSLDVVVHLASSSDVLVREASLRYFLEHFEALYSKSYQVQHYAEVRFIPAVDSNGNEVLEQPSKVFCNSECSIMGFFVAKPSLRLEAINKLQLSENPSPSQLVESLVENPPASTQATRVFEYLSGQVSHFNAAHFRHLKDQRFIPALSGAQSIFTSPTECYIGTSGAALHSKLFLFVDFGERANLFLRACGAKTEPTSEQMAEKLIKDARQFYELAGGPEQYVEELRRIAANLSRVEKRTQDRMRRSSILLGSRKSRKNTDINANNDGSDDEDSSELTYQILRPDELVIIDDTNAYRIFNTITWAAPQDDIIENFYRELGVRTISSLVHEEYLPLGLNHSNKAARETRALVLERLPLFLHDQRGHSTVFNFDWLNRDGNFQVVAVGKLQIRSTFTSGNASVSKTRAASAGAKRDGKGPVILYIAENDRLDYFELAHSICHIIFQQHRVNDSLLFMTVLSTDIRALKRRGYNVDRILNQQKLDREKRALEVQQTIGDRSLVPGSTTDGEAPKGSEGTLNRRPESAYPVNGNPFTSSLERLGHKLRSSVNNAPSSIPGSFPWSNSLPNPFTPSERASSRITSTHDIERNMQIAVSACREERSDRVQNRAKMTLVKETQKDGAYCDVTGEADISLVASIQGYNVFMSNGITDRSGTFNAKRNSIDRFASIINPLRDQVYVVPARSIAIFYDLEGPLIAFNRGGAIFLNLRYYEEWHDGGVSGGALSQARISWFFVLAHEIAHNLVQAHNAEHEFYFSRLCEGHLQRLVPHLSG